jgi:uncharacterized integral membrane protein
MLKGTINNKAKIVGVAVIVLIVLIVVLQNTQVVETKLLFLTVTMPNAALLFGTLIVGFVQCEARTAELSSVLSESETTVNKNNSFKEN